MRFLLSISTTEISNCNNCSNFSGHKCIEMENQIDEFRKKQLLFKMKSEDTRAKLSWLKNVADVARDLCPPSPTAKPPSIKCTDSEVDFYYNLMQL